MRTHPSSLYLVGALPRERQEWTRAPTNKRQRKGGLGLLSVQVLMRQQPGRGHSSHVITAVMWIKNWTAVTSWETCKERRVFSWTFLYLYSIYILWFKKCPWVYSLTAHPLISSYYRQVNGQISWSITGKIWPERQSESRLLRKKMNEPWFVRWQIMRKDARVLVS